MATKKVRVEQIDPIFADIVYYHYYDMTVLHVTYKYEDGSTSVDTASTSSSVYHIIEHRAFFRDVKRKIKHNIILRNYID